MSDAVKGTRFLRSVYHSYRLEDLEILLERGLFAWARSTVTVTSHCPWRSLLVKLLHVSEVDPPPFSEDRGFSKQIRKRCNGHSHDNAPEGT